MQIESSSTSSQAIECTESESQSYTISSVSETQCPIDGMTASREIGIQCELLVDHIPIIKPLTSCIATQTESMLLELHTPALANLENYSINKMPGLQIFNSIKYIYIYIYIYIYMVLITVLGLPAFNCESGLQKNEMYIMPDY